MKFSNELMSDPNVQKNKINQLKRTERNSWAESIELDIREFSPYPISYDVTCTHPTNFTEYAYTELLGGMYLHTHSIDINCRIIDLASKVPSNDDTIYDNLKQLLTDKYFLGNDVPERFKNIDEIIFMPGSNIADIASADMIGRICADEKVMVKPHPLTNEAFARILAKTCGGWNRIIPANLSGMYFLQNAKKVYTTAASEMSISAYILEKEVINVGAYKFESAAAYYPIARVLFNSENPLKALINIIDCKWSGLLFPWQEDYIERAKAFYAKSLELREIYKPLHGPINFPHTSSKKPETEFKNVEKDKNKPIPPKFNKLVHA